MALYVLSLHSSGFKSAINSALFVLTFPGHSGFPTMLWYYSVCPSRLALGNTWGYKSAKHFKIDVGPFLECVSLCAARVPSILLQRLCCYISLSALQLLQALRHLQMKQLCCPILLWMKAVLRLHIHLCFGERRCAVDFILCAAPTFSSSLWKMVCFA